MLKAYKYRLYPTKEQEVTFSKHFGCTRFIYNWGLNLKTQSYAKDKKSLSCWDIKKQLPTLKAEKEWLSEVNSQSLQQAIMNLDMAFNHFFRRVKEHNIDPGYPTKKHKRDKQSFQCPQHIKVDFENRTITLPKIPNVHVKFSRTFEGEVRTTTISKTPSGKYFVSILVDNKIALPEKPKIDPAKTIGIDLGLHHFLITSDGKKINNPRFNKNEAKRIAKLNHDLHRKVKGSKNRNKQRVQLACRYERIANRRNDFLHKVSSQLIRENQTICVEDLNVAGMQHNHKLAGSIGDVGWSMFVNMLDYKSNWYGKNVIKIGRFDPSSRICSSCGYYNNGLTLQDREWTCPECKTNHDRDVNAGVNIKNFALQRQNLINQVPVDNREVTSVEIEPLPSRSGLKSKFGQRSRNQIRENLESQQL